jgi:dienelactone hydrolase
MRPAKGRPSIIGAGQREAIMALERWRPRADLTRSPDARIQALLGRAQAVAAPATEDASGLRIAFQNSPGWQLAGRLLVPAGPGPPPVVTFAHGWGSGKDSPRNRATAEALRARGFAAFLFDFTGHGESEGTLDQSTPAQQADDLRAALNMLEALDEIDPRRMGVVGASSGAAAALLRASEDKRIRALVLRSGNPTGAEAVAPHVTVPTLLIVGELDEPARATNQELTTRLGGPLRIEIVSGGDHLFEGPDTLRRASDLTAAWFLEHLRTPAHG